MIAVASIVVHFFKDEQCMVSKYNLLYVVYRTAQITVGRMMKTDGIVDFLVVLSDMSLNPTSKTFWPFLQDPLCCALPPWRSLSRTLNLFAVFKTLTYLTQQDGHLHRTVSCSP